MAGDPDGFDLDSLLAPIPGDLPCGADPREDISPKSVYFRLRDARAEARAAEREADTTPDVDSPPVPQWRVVADLARQALTTAAKDLEVAAWLTEATVRSHGLPGLAACARLMAGLVERYWDENLYPTPDEDGIATRVAPLVGLNGEGGDGTLIQPLRKLPLFALPDGAPLAFWKYEQSADLLKITERARRERALASGVLVYEEVEKLARAAGAARLAPLRADARDAAGAWQALADAVDARAGADSPPTSRVRDLLADILRVAVKYAPAETVVTEGDTVEPAPDGVAAEAVGAVGRVAEKSGASREDMLRDLSRIAEYFRRTEPHSPLSYTLDEAVRRGRLTWPELLQELVPEVAARSGILSSLGIRPTPDEPA